MESPGKPECNPSSNIWQIYLDFMGRVAELDELMNTGTRLLAGFQQGLDYIRRPPFEKTSSRLIDQIIKSNETKRLSSYIEAGGGQVHDMAQSTSKSKEIVDGLEVFVRSAAAEVVVATENLHCPELEDVGPDNMTSPVKKPDATDYAATMAVIYNMVKLDYRMQERIVSALSLKSSSGELESYCLMWSLRPFIDEEIMHAAWKLIP